MNPSLPEEYSKTIFYRVSKNGAVISRNTWEDILALPPGLFYLESSLISHNNYNGNWHIRYDHIMYDIDKNKITPIAHGFYLLDIVFFLNTASWPQYPSCVSVAVENQEMEQKTIHCNGGVDGGLKAIFSELELIEDKYRGAFMEYIVGESNGPYIKIRDTTRIEIVKKRH